MQALINLIPNPANTDQFVPRPARDYLTNFIAQAFSTTPTVISGLTVFGDFAYGLISTGRNPGHDEPFCVDLITGQILVVSNVNADNCPTTPPLVGATIKPLFALVGGRVLVTAPGFPGGTNNPGSAATFTSNAHLGSPILDGYAFTAPQILVGQVVTDTGGAIPGGTVVIAVADVDIVTTVTAAVTGNNFYDVADATGAAIGQLVGGPALGSGFVTGIAGNTITYSGTVVQDIPAFLPALVVFDSLITTSVTSAVTGSSSFDVLDPTGITPGMDVNGYGLTGGTVTTIFGNTVTFTGLVQLDLPQPAPPSPASFRGTVVTLSQNATADVTADVFTSSAAGNRAVKFGWWDISRADFTKSGTTANGADTVTVPDVSGIQPGLLVSGTGILPNTTVIDIDNPFTQGIAVSLGVGDTSILIYYGSPQLPGQVPPFVLPVSGQTISGPGLASGTTVAGPPVITGSGVTYLALSVPLSTPAIATVAQNNLGFIYSFSGLAILQISQPATATGTVTLTFTGGAPDAPLWDAGDTAINGLPSTPIGVGSMNGRAYFACGHDGIPFSDSLYPCVRTNASQALIPGNGLAVTHCVGQPLTTPITGGIVQSLYAFQGVGAIQQITGDQVTQDLKMNALNVGTGTGGPATIVPTTVGMAFVSPEGLRIIDFSGVVSQPIGEAGTGVTLPFINVFDATRMVAAANGNTIRVSLQDARTVGQPWVEWWYDLSRKVFTGPHTLQTSTMAPYGVSFITAAQDVPAQLYKSPSEYSGLVDHNEDGTELTWTAWTCLLPDTESMSANTINEGTLGLVLPSDSPVIVEAFDEFEAPLDSVVLPGPYTIPVWGGQPVWGTGSWYATPSRFTQWPLDWHVGLDFKQISFRMRGASRFGAVLGALRLRYQQLGFLMDPHPSVGIEIIVPALPGASIVNGSPLAMQAAANAARFTRIGAVLALAAHNGPALPAEDTLTFNQAESFALLAYSSSTVTGNTHASFTIDGLSSDVIAEGWLIGHRISDTAGAIPDGTYITDISAGGLAVTLSQQPLFVATGTTLTVSGTNLVTNWVAPIAAGQVFGQIRAQAYPYLTSYLPFLVTVT